MEIIDKFNWRYATKMFDTSKKISEQDLDILKESIRLAPTSYGLQPFEVIIVENPQIREELKTASWGQGQITDASHLLVFTVKNKLTNDDVHSFIDNIVETRQIERKMVGQYEDLLLRTVESLTDEQKKTWIINQIYLTLGFLLSTASLLNIDACPMEGFDKSGYDRILELSDSSSVVVCALGYRSEEDTYQHMKKVRKSIFDIFSIK